MKRLSVGTAVLVLALLVGVASGEAQEKYTVGYGAGT